MVVVAFAAANLPWLYDRFLLFILPKEGKKKVWMCLIDLLLMYFIFGLFSLGLEKKYTGELHQQDWEFYWVSFFIFLVFSTPGFIYKYQLRHYLKNQ